MENFSRDGNTRPPDLPPEKSVCRSRSNTRTRRGTTDWFQVGKGVHQECILSPHLFNLYAEYIMQNAGLDEAEAGIKIARINIWDRNLLQSFITALTSKIDYCYKCHHHCKATCTWEKDCNVLEDYVIQNAPMAKKKKKTRERENKCTS